jgi:hypothetical protein
MCCGSNWRKAAFRAAWMTRAATAHRCRTPNRRETSRQTPARLDILLPEPEGVARVSRAGVDVHDETVAARLSTSQLLASSCRPLPAGLDARRRVFCFRAGCDVDISCTSTVERSAMGPTAKSIRIGVYLTAQADCTSGTLPAIRLVAPPANGTVSIKRGKVTATNYKQCLALEVPGFIALYQSKPDFVGTDMAIIEVKYPQGRTELQRITINVGTGSGG